MDEVNADGVDFVPIWFDKKILPPIICSYIREEWQYVQVYPKSNRMYWKMVDGKKVYVNK